MPSDYFTIKGAFGRRMHFNSLITVEKYVDVHITTQLYKHDIIPADIDIVFHHERGARLTIYFNNETDAMLALDVLRNSNGFFEIDEQGL